MIYAIRLKGRWYIAKKSPASEYRIDGNDVWSEVYTTALLCSVGAEDQCVVLEQ